MLDAVITQDTRPGFHVTVSPIYDSSPNHQTLQNQIIFALTKKFLSILRGYVIDRMVITTMAGFDVNGQQFAPLADGTPSYGVKTGGMIKRFMQYKGGIKYIKQSGDFKLTIAPPGVEEVFVQTQAVKQVMKKKRRKGWLAEDPSKLEGYWTHPSGPPYVFFHGREVRRIKTSKFERTSRWGGLTQTTTIKFKEKFNRGGQPPRYWLGVLPKQPFNVEGDVKKDIIDAFYNAMVDFVHDFNYAGRERQAIANFYKAVDAIKNKRKPFRTRALRLLSSRKRAVKRKELQKKALWEAKKARWAENKARAAMAAADEKTRQYLNFTKKYNIRTKLGKIKATTTRKVLKGEKFIAAEEARTRNMLNFSRKYHVKVRFSKIYGTSRRRKR